MVVVFPIKGADVLIDDEDLPLLQGHRWYYSGTPATSHRYVYTPDTHLLGTSYLHRVITQAPPDLVVDHINHDTLDNRRCNLRVVPQQQNAANRRGANKHSLTGIRGVRRRANHYEVSVTAHGVAHFIGCFWDIREAEQAAIAARARLHGDPAPYIPTSVC